MAAITKSNNLTPNSAPWGREVTDAVNDLSTRFGNLENNQTNKDRGQGSNIQLLSSQVNTLQTAGQVYYGEYANITANLAGYVGSLLQFQMPSGTATGRLELQYGGSANSGNGYFLYQIATLNPTYSVYTTKESVFGNYSQRVAVSGGSAFAPSGYKSTIVNVPANIPLQVEAWAYAETNGWYILGGSFLARAAV